MGPGEVGANIDRLVGADIIRPVDSGNRLQLTDEFERLMSRYKESIRQTDSLHDVCCHRLTDDEDQLMTKILTDDRTFAATYFATAESIADCPPDERLSLTVALDVIGRPSQRTAGAPAPFIPVRGDQLETFTTVFSKAIIYVWSGECEPCEIVRNDFESIFDESPDDIALLAVHGPEWASLLYEQFAVVGAPTAVFVRNKRIDSRLTGANHVEVLEHEISMLRGAG